TDARSRPGRLDPDLRSWSGHRPVPAFKQVGGRAKDAAGEGGQDVNVRVTSISSLLSAFLSSLCCAGPLILGVLGVGAGATANFVKVLLPYRQAFIALTVLFLAVGFISVYRRKGACSTDPGCPMGTAKAIKIALWVATAAALILILLPDLLAVGI